MRYGIMGGTFDPVHNGHLISAEDAIQLLGLSDFYFIPAFNPPHKRDKYITPFEHRFEMLKLATMHSSRLKVLEIEQVRGGVSYTIETLRELRDMWGYDCEIFFLLGADSFLELPTWREPDKISELSKLVIMPRVGISLDSSKALEVLSLLKEGSVIRLNNRIIEVSSAEIRKRVLLGFPITYMVPSQVEEYIISNNLYKKGG